MGRGRGLRERLCWDVWGKRDATETRGMTGGALGHPSWAGDGEPCVQSGGRITDMQKQNLPELGTC